MSRKSLYRKSGYLLLGLFLLFEGYIFLRIHWFASCVIPTYSMSPTLIGGDYICASLQIPGRREFSESATNVLTVKRQEGIRSVQKGDVVVFNFPYAENKDRIILSMKQFYCKRCVAVPGNTYHAAGRFFFGTEIYVPKNGDILLMDSINYVKYNKCIEYETGKNLYQRKSEVFMNDSLITSYRFRHDYYFMAGDNVNDSYDSRFWGLVPDDFILGVGRFIWFSKDMETGKIRWNRMFKKI